MKKFVLKLLLFIIPFRKYFVAEMHGKFPFPEATATTEILVAGEKGGKQALVLVVSGLIGGFYDFIIAEIISGVFQLHLVVKVEGSLRVIIKA